MMAKCFVIQPFDHGKFDKRYDDVLAPAIKNAELEPYRVDRGHSVSIPIDEIQKGIEASRACLADISTDNPNVWFELGYAIATRREVVLICSNERTSRFPFDVQHRNIIQYSTDSSRDFTELGQSITSRLRALLTKEMQIEEISRMSSVATVEGLEQHEIATLVAVAQQIDGPSGGVTNPLIRQDLEKAGFTQIACTLGLKRLLDMKMLYYDEEGDYDNPYIVYRLTSNGMQWLLNNQNKLKLKREPPPSHHTDTDLPF